MPQSASFAIKIHLKCQDTEYDAVIKSHFNELYVLMMKKKEKQQVLMQNWFAFYSDL